MHFPKYKQIRIVLAKRFFPTDSAGAALSISTGKPIYYPEVDHKGAEILKPTTVRPADARQARFTSKRKALQWLQKFGKVITIIETEECLIRC